MTTRLTKAALLVVLSGWLFWSAAGVASADVSPAEQTAMLSAHNTLRRNVAMAETQRLGQTISIPDLTWNTMAAATAQAWADNLLATNTFSHNPNLVGLGENIYLETGNNPLMSGDRALGAWAEEKRYYTWDTNSCTMECGHYTQLVWAASTSVGCGKSTNGMKTYWVCDYAPPGNFNGQRPYEPGGAAPAPATGSTSGSAMVTYAAGWNIVAGPSGTLFSQASGPLYTLQAGDTGYQMLSGSSQVVAGRGYWAYFPSSATVSLSSGMMPRVTIRAAAGQWVMVGNPSATATATVQGADFVYVWDPVANMFTQTTSLPAGRGAWAYSTSGGTITIGS